MRLDAIQDQLREIAPSRNIRSLEPGIARSELERMLFQCGT